MIVCKINIRNNYNYKAIFFPCKMVNMPNAIERLVFQIQTNQYTRSIAVYFGFPNPPGRMFESTQTSSNEFLKHLINLRYFIHIKKNTNFRKKWCPGQRRLHNRYLWYIKTDTRVRLAFVLAILYDQLIGLKIHIRCTIDNLAIDT